MLSEVEVGGVTLVRMGKFKIKKDFEKTGTSLIFFKIKVVQASS